MPLTPPTPPSRPPPPSHSGAVKNDLVSTRAGSARFPTSWCHVVICCDDSWTRPLTVIYITAVMCLRWSHLVSTGGDEAHEYQAPLCAWSAMQGVTWSLALMRLWQVWPRDMRDPLFLRCGTWLLYVLCRSRYGWNMLCSHWGTCQSHHN